MDSRTITVTPGFNGTHDTAPKALLPQPITNAGTYDPVVTVVCRDVNLITISGAVSGIGPITGLKLTAAAIPGGNHVDRIVDKEFIQAQGTVHQGLDFLRFATLNCWNDALPTATGTTFMFTVDTTGLGELKLYAKSDAGASIAVEVGA